MKKYRLKKQLSMAILLTLVILAVDCRIQPWPGENKVATGRNLPDCGVTATRPDRSRRAGGLPG